MAYNDESSASGHDEPWIQWFCGLKGHEMFCEVERSYIEDGFNLYGLRACVTNFSDCLDLILDRIGPDDSDDSHLTQSACTLYGLIHARYVITAHGLDAMYNKYAAKEFGTCPLVQCEGQPVLPVGLKDEMGADTVKIFCPKCQCVYHPPPVRSRHQSLAGSMGSGGVDGASFGTTFPHLFLMTFSNLVPDPLPVDSAYVPRVFGFRVHPSARQRGGGSSPTTASQPAVASGAAGQSDKRPAAKKANAEMDGGNEKQSDVPAPQDLQAEKQVGERGERSSMTPASPAPQQQDPGLEEKDLTQRKDGKKKLRRSSSRQSESDSLLPNAEKKRKAKENSNKDNPNKTEEESTENGNGSISNKSKRQKRTSVGGGD